MTPSLQIPDSLVELPQWVVWRYAERDGNLTKVPYQLPDYKGESYPAASDNPKTWTSFSSAFDTFSSAPEFWNGVGFVFSPDDPYFGVDVDNCLLPDGDVKSWAQPVLARFSDSYAEISPSRKGIKIWARGKMPGKGVAFKLGDGRLEIYDQVRYFTVTGLHWGGQLLDIEDHQKDLEWLLSLSPHGEHKAPFKIEEKIAKGTQYDTLVSFAGSLRARGAGFETVNAALQAMNRDQCSEPGTEEAIRKIAENSMRWEQGKPNTNGHSNGRPAQAQISAAQSSPQQSEPEPPVEQSLTWEEKLSLARDLTQAVIDSNDDSLLYGTRANPATYMVALAALGSLEQRATRRILKEKFKHGFVAREWDEQLQYEKSKLQIESQKATPYILNDDGGCRVIVANAITMLAGLPIAWNYFSCRAFLTSVAPWGSEGNWTDYDDIKAAEWCQHQGLHIPPTMAMDACIAVAKDRKPYFHPVAEYLKSLEWDQEPRVDKWLSRYLGTVDNPYTRAVGSKWLISAVKRVCEPGCQADYTLVFEGMQGKKKSTALGALAGREWFTDDISDIGSKDSAIQLQGKWIVELAELDAIRKAEVTTVKAWLVRRDDHFRPPYGRRAEDFPRQNVFAASTNKEDWGHDDTGLRRFWPVKAGEFRDIDIEGITEDRDQIWAEAYRRYLDKEKIWLEGSVEAEATAEQHDRQEADPWTPLIENWLEDPSCRSEKIEDRTAFQSRSGAIFLSEILRNCIGIPEKDWNRLHKDRVSRVLRIAGYATKRMPRKEAERLKLDKRPEYWVPTRTL